MKWSATEWNVSPIKLNKMEWNGMECNGMEWIKTYIMERPFFYNLCCLFI